MTATNILILGAGAIGAFYASRLALAPDVHVSVICRSNFDAVSTHGFRVTSPQYGTYTYVPARVFASPDEARSSGITWDYIIVSTKALPDVSDDSRILEGLMGKRTAVVLIQNGLGVEEPYAKRFPQAVICSAVTIASCAQPEPGHIRHHRWTRINSGPYLPHLDTGGGPEGRKSDQDAAKCNDNFIDLLQKGGIKDAASYSHAKLQMTRWHKIAINASMNPTSVLSGGLSNNAMSFDPELSQHLLATMQEVLDTAPRVLGVPLPKEFATAEQILRSTQKNTSGSKPSMAVDWEQGKRMELEVILGNPIRLARERGFEMPRMQTLYAILRSAQEARDAKVEQSRSKM